MWTKRSGPGRFGMAEETGRILNEVIRSAQSRQEGLGQAVGAYLSAANARWADRSLIATAHRLQIPVTVHVAIGTDIIHMHEDASGAAIGDASLRDFRYFTVVCGTTLRRRVSELRFGRRSAGGLLEGGGAGAKSGGSRWMD